eukprot:m.1353846 g.1353846  ORF g.1353846 m.1353846 type:complete len:362 (+) comp24931_c0_seq1:203-1288(+)
MAGHSLHPGQLLQDEKFQHKTCGMHESLVAELRSAHSAPNRSLTVQGVCKFLLEQLKQTVGIDAGANIGVVVGPPVGKATAVAFNGDSRHASLVVWFLLDTIDIDSKQTTFIRLDNPASSRIFDLVYKLSYPNAAEHQSKSEIPPAPPDVPHRNPLHLQHQTRIQVSDLISTIVQDSIYLGPYFFSQSKFEEAFGGESPKSIVNCDPNLPMMNPECHCTRIEIEDCAPPNDNIGELLRQAASAIARHESPIYVHCSEGVGRSPSCVIAYLVQEKRMLVSDALAHVQSCRPCACPHPGYVQALLGIEAAMREGQEAPSVDISMYQMFYDADRTAGYEHESYAEWLHAKPPPPPARHTKVAVQ